MKVLFAIGCSGIVRNSYFLTTTINVLRYYKMTELPNNFEREELLQAFSDSRTTHLNYQIYFSDADGNRVEALLVIDPDYFGFGDIFTDYPTKVKLPEFYKAYYNSCLIVSSHNTVIRQYSLKMGLPNANELRERIIANSNDIHVYERSVLAVCDFFKTNFELKIDPRIIK